VEAGNAKMVSNDSGDDTKKMQEDLLKVNVSLDEIKQQLKVNESLDEIKQQLKLLVAKKE
jgi:hypothetical protein